LIRNRHLAYFKGGPKPFWRVHSGCDADRGGTFGLAGLEERRRLAGTTSRSPSTTYVPSPTVGHNPAPQSCNTSPSPTSPTQTQRMAMLRCLRGSSGVNAGIYWFVACPWINRPAGNKEFLTGVEEQTFRFQVGDIQQGSSVLQPV